MKSTLSILIFAFATLFANTFAYAAYHNVFRRDGTIECCDVIHDGLGPGGGPSAYDCTSGTCGRYNEDEANELASREDDRRDIDEEDNQEIEQARDREDVESGEVEPRVADEEGEQPEELAEDDLLNEESGEEGDARDSGPSIDPEASRVETTTCDCPPLVTVSHSSGFEPDCAWICGKKPSEATETPVRLEGATFTPLKQRKTRRATSQSKTDGVNGRTTKQSAIKTAVKVKGGVRVIGEAADGGRNNLCCTVCPDYSVVWHECPGPAACLDGLIR